MVVDGFRYRFVESAIVSAFDRGLFSCAFSMAFV